jgi:putative peptide zinc metalloprotease protein
VERLGPAHIGLRPDLEVHRHLYRKKPYYIIRDPITLQCHRVNHKEYEIIVCLTADQSLADTFDSLVQQEKLQQDNEPDFYDFVVMLHRLGFLNLPMSDDKSLYRRFQAKQKAKRNAKLKGFMFLQIPVFNPDAILNRTIRYARHLFTRRAFLIWVCLMSTCGFIAICKREELASPISNVFSARNMVAMWFILIFLKAIHEFGHAYACKVRGGFVPEMGIFMIVGTPCAYVDVTSSWSFTSKRDRVIVGLGGMYFESYIACIAFLFWNVTSSPFLLAFTFNIFLLSSFVTVLMNINPLMRFDGYYILSDLMELPNLRKRSQAFATGVMKRIFLSVPLAEQNETGGLRIFLFIFGVASSVYKVTIVLGISMMVATKAFLIGMAIGGYYIITELVKVIKKVTLYLWKSPESAPMRGRAIGLSALLLIGVPLTMLYVPVPSRIQAAGQLMRENEQVLRSRQAGFLESVNVQPGQSVDALTPVFALSNPEVEEDLLDVEARLASSRILVTAYQKRPSHSHLLQEQMEKTRALAVEKDFYMKQYEDLTIHSVAPGTVLDMPEDHDIGKFVKAGEPLGKIVSGNWVVRVLVSQEDIAQVQPAVGQELDIRFAGQPNATFRGAVQEITPSGSDKIPLPALTSLGEGEIAVDEKSERAGEPYFQLTVAINDSWKNPLHYGMTGQVKLYSPPKSIGKSLTQKILRFVHSLNKN